MSDNLRLNGCDYLMLGFDHELRRRGFAGNSCQMVLDLSAAISADELRRRLRLLFDHYPILNARPGSLFMPKWKLPGRTLSELMVRVHRDEPGLHQRIVNDPLDLNTGELIRFDLIELADGGMQVVFNWAHALMDAPAAEHFLAIVGREDLPWPAARPIEHRQKRLPFTQRSRMAWKTLHQIDRYCEAPPQSLGTRHHEASPLLRHRIEQFSADETERVRANGIRHCGILGAAQYHGSVAMVELHRLHQRLERSSPSYVLPVPVGLRPKGTIEPLFSNQVTMLMVQFLPEQLLSVTDAVAALKTHTGQAMRNGLIESGVILSEMFRFLPLPIYMAILKQGLRGEICSLFYGDTASVSPLLTSFFGVPIEDLTHVAAVTPSPGVGVIFYHFRGVLRLTVLHLSTVLNEAEAAEFAARLRARLLEP
jgi:hypothetical protein